MLTSGQELKTERDITDSQALVGLVVLGMTVLTTLSRPLILNSGTLQIYYVIFLCVFIVGLFLNSFNEWLQLFASRNTEPFIKIAIFEDKNKTLMWYIILLVVLIGVMWWLISYGFSYNWFISIIMGFAVVVVGINLAMISLPIVILILAVMLGVWIMALLTFWAYVPMFIAFYLVFYGLILASTYVYSFFLYIKIATAKEPLQEVLKQYHMLTTEQLYKRIEVAVLSSNNEDAHIWEIERRTELSKKVTDKLKADKELIDSFIDKARAERKEKILKGED